MRHFGVPSMLGPGTTMSGTKAVYQKISLGHVAFGKVWQVCVEIHTPGARRCILIKPFNVLAKRVLGSRAVDVAAAAYARADWSGIVILFDADTPFVNREAVWNAFVAVACHGQPRVSKPPAKVRRLLSVVVVAIYLHR